MTTQDNLSIIFSLYSLGRSVQSLGKQGNTDMLLEAYILREVNQQQCNISKLSDQLPGKMSAVSEKLIYLEHRSLINREKCPKDNRRKQLSLTKKGEKRLAELETMLGTQTPELLAPLTKQEIKQLQNILTKIT